MFIILYNICYNVHNNKHGDIVMNNKKHILIMPKTDRILKQVGEQIRLARLRRKIPAGLVAERAGISRATVWKVEKGDSTVSMAAYAKVLSAIGLQNDLLHPRQILLLSFSFYQ